MAQINFQENNQIQPIKQQIEGSYFLKNLFPSVNISGTITDVTQTTQWDIPEDVMSWYNALINFEIEVITETGALANSEANTAFSTRSDFCQFFRDVRFSVQNFDLLRLNSVGEYSKCASYANLDINRAESDLMSKSNRRAGLSAHATSMTTDNFPRFNNADANGYLANANSPKITDIGTIAGTYSRYRSLKLRDILPDSFFNINQDFFTSQSKLELTWDIKAKILQQINENGAAAAFVADRFVKLSNLSLTVFIQNDPLLRQLAMDYSKKPEPNRIAIPFPTYNQIPSQQVGQLKSSNLKITSQQSGSRLYKLYYTTVKRPQALTSHSVNNNIDTATGIKQVTLTMDNRDVFRLNVRDMPKYIAAHWKNSNVKDVDNMQAYGCLPILFASDPSHSQEYNDQELKGRSFGVNNQLDVVVSAEYNGAGQEDTQTFFSVLTIPFYYKNGKFSYSPNDL